MNLFDESKDDILKQYSKKPVAVCFSEEAVYIHDKAVLDVSIILPCFNSEQYLRECLDSLISQETKASYEIIAINDGSTDNTEMILEEYSSRVGCIKVISQENRGFSGARNRGIHESVGKYLMFVDSDDYVSANYIEGLISVALENNADIVACGYYSFRGKTVYKKVIPSDEEDCSLLNGCFWGKAFKRELFSHVMLPEGFWFEDSILAHLIYPDVKVYCSVSGCVYAYRSNPKGITLSSKGKPKSLDTFYITDLMIESARKKFGDSYILSDSYCDLLVDQFYLNQRRLIDAPIAIQKGVFNFQSDYTRRYLKKYEMHRVDRKGYWKALKNNNFSMALVYVKCDKLYKLFNRVIKR